MPRPRKVSKVLLSPFLGPSKRLDIATLEDRPLSWAALAIGLLKAHLKSYAGAWRALLNIFYFIMLFLMIGVFKSWWDQGRAAPDVIFYVFGVLNVALYSIHTGSLHAKLDARRLEAHWFGVAFFDALWGVGIPLVPVGLLFCLFFPQDSAYFLLVFVLALFLAILRRAFAFYPRKTGSHETVAAMTQD